MAVFQSSRVGRSSVVRQPAPLQMRPPQNAQQSNQQIQQLPQRQPLNLGGYGGGGLNVSAQGGQPGIGQDILKSLIKIPVKAALSLGEIPAAIKYPEQSKQLSYNLPFLGNTRSYSNDINAVGDQYVAGEKPMSAVVGAMAKPIIDIGGLAVGGGTAGQTAKGAGALMNSMAIGGGINFLSEGADSLSKGNGKYNALVDALKGAGTGALAGGALHGAIALPSAAVSGVRKIAANSETKANTKEINRLISDYKNTGTEVGVKSSSTTNLEKGQKVFDIPKQSDSMNTTPGRIVENMTITKMKSDMRRSPELRAALGERSFTHEVKNTQDMINRSIQRVSEDPMKALDYIKTHNNDEAVTTAHALQTHFQSLGDTEGEIMVLNEIIPQGTEHARALRMNYLWSRVSPEGIVKLAAKKVQKYNELNPTKSISLSVDDANTLKSMATEAQNLSGHEKQIATVKLLDKVDTLIPSSLMDQATTVWKAGLLSGLTTHGRNIIGTGGHIGLDTLSNALAVPIDKIASLFTGKRSKFLTPGKVFSEGISSGIKNAASYAKTGVDLENTLAKYDHVKVNLPKPLQAYTDFIYRILGAEDKLFKGVPSKASLWEQAMADGWNNGLRGEKLVEYTRELYQNPTTAMLDIAKEAADRATFNNSNALASMVNQGKRNANPFVRGATEFIAPFARTPANVGARILDYAPTGFVKAGIHAATGKGQQAVVEDLSRAIAGSGIIAGGYGLGKAGMMTGNYPVDATQRATWDAQGLQPNALKIGGRTYSMNALSPVGNLLGIGSGIQQLQGQVKPEAYPAAIAALGGQTLVNQTFLQGLSGTLNAIQDPARSASTWANSAASGVIPSIIGSAAKAVDPTMRQSNSMADAIQSRIPGLSQGLLPKVDLLGQNRTYNNGSIIGRLGQMYDPFTTRDVRQSPVIDEINRLDQSGSSISAALPGKNVSMAGYNVKLTPEEYTRLEQQTGGQINEVIGKIIESDQYKQFSDYDKANVLNKIIQNVRKSWNTQNIGTLQNSREQILNQAKKKNSLNNSFYTK